MIGTGKEPLYATEVTNLDDERKLPAVFAYKGYTFFADEEDPNDATNTLCISYDGKDIVQGLSANKRLINAVSEYCSSGGAVWMSRDFKKNVALYKKEHNL